MHGARVYLFTERMCSKKLVRTVIGVLQKAMPEPSPAKTKISIEKNSAKAALIASGWLASPGVPTAILEIAIFSFL